MISTLYKEYFGGEMLGDFTDPESGKKKRRSILLTPSEMHVIGKWPDKRFKLEEIDKGARWMREYRFEWNIEGHALANDIPKEIIENSYGNGIESGFQRVIEPRRDITFPKLSGPRGMFLEITPACHLDCITCYNEFARSGNGTRLGEDDKMRIVDELFSLGGNFVALTGGESTLSPDWFELSREIKNKGMDLRLYTCGVYDSKARTDTIAKIKEISPEEIRITYTGMRDTNDHVRIKKPGFARCNPSGTGSGTFDDITATVEELLSDKMHVKLNYILADENSSELERFLEFAYSLSSKYDMRIPVNVGPLRTYGNASKDHSFSFTRPKANMIKDVNKTIQYMRQKLGLEISSSYDCDRIISENEETTLKWNRDTTPWTHLHQGCSLGRQVISIGHDGKVQVCGIMDDSYKDNLSRIISENPEYYGKFGITTEKISSGEFESAKTHSLEDIWYESPILAYFQYFYKKGACEPCDSYRVRCMGMCPAMSLQDSGDLRGIDRGCYKAQDNE